MASAAMSGIRMNPPNVAVVPCWAEPPKNPSSANAASVRAISPGSSTAPRSPRRAVGPGPDPAHDHRGRPRPAPRGRQARSAPAAGPAVPPRPRACSPGTCHARRSCWCPRMDPAHEPALLRAAIRQVIGNVDPAGRSRHPPRAMTFSADEDTTSDDLPLMGHRASWPLAEGVLAWKHRGGECVSWMFERPSRWVPGGYVQ